MIYTTYFAKLKKLLSNITPITICGKALDWWTGLQYKKLAPKWSFFSVWKETHDNDYYVENCNKLVLNTLSAEQVINELKTMSPTEDIALVRYEKPGDFCHRHLVAKWLTDNGFTCEEYTYGG